jgi:hypothetical protein
MIRSNHENGLARTFAMADSRSSTVLADQLGTLYRLGTVGGLRDGELVERFLARNDPAASEKPGETQDWGDVQVKVNLR